MKKVLAMVLAGILAFSTYTLAFAAPPAEAPSEMSVEQDGNFHSVYVFGTTLLLISEDESAAILNIGPVGRVDVMMDGVDIKNVASVDIPTGQKTEIAIDTDSIIVKNVTAESAESVIKQIEDAYAAGVSSIDLKTLTGVAAYKVNADGIIVDVDGKETSVSTRDLSVSSIAAKAKAFEEKIKEITEEERAREAAAPQPAPISDSGSSSSSASDSSSSSSSGGSSSTPSPVPSYTP